MNAGSRADTKWKPYPKYKDSGVEWLSEIPDHWDIKRLKYVARLQYGESLEINNRENGEVPVFGSNGPVGTHSIPNTLAPMVVIGRKGSFGKIAYSEFRGFCIDTTYFIDSRFSNENLRWLFYALQILHLDKISRDTGVPGLSREKAYENILSVSSLLEQCAIAAFLDQETAKIDGLIAKKERLIELLQEKRAAIISHAVTKGLDPSVPMKDSGVVWLEEVPKHWNILQLRRVVRKFVDYRGATPEKVPYGIPLITAKNIKNGFIDFDLSQEFIREEDYDEWMVRGIPEIGDVLITTEAPLGESAQIQETNIALAQRIILLKAHKCIIKNDYLKYQFAATSGKAELWSRATGSTAIGIKASHLREVLVTVPPLNEQKIISKYIDRESANIDALIYKIQDGIGKLKEYRSGLISAAVSGKIDVRQEGA